MTEKRGLIRHGLMLSTVSLLLRSSGLIFGSFITARVGAEGTGLNALVSSVYAPALMLSTGGVNLAVSRLTAEECGKGNEKGVGYLLRRALLYCLVISLPVSLILFCSAGRIGRVWLGNADSGKLLRCLSLSLPPAALNAAISGYFLAVRRVEYHAALSMLEEALRIFLTTGALSIFPVSYGIGCLLTVTGTSLLVDWLSVGIGMAFARGDLLKHRLRGKKVNHPGSRFFSIVIPVSVSSFFRSGLTCIEHLLIPRGLQRNGMTYAESMAAYGTVGGMALPIILFPSSFLFSFLGLLIPEIAEDMVREDRTAMQKTVRRTLRAVLIFGIGCGGILMGFSHHLGMAVFGSREAGRYIGFLSPLLPIMYLDSAVDGLLKGLGEQVWTMKINLLDASFSTAAVFFLLPRFGMNGYLFILYAGEILNFSLSYFRLLRKAGIIDILSADCRKPLLSVGIAVLFSVLFIDRLYPVLLSSALSAGFGITLSCLLYLFLLALFSGRAGRLFREGCHVCRSIHIQMKQRLKEKSKSAPAALSGNKAKKGKEYHVKSNTDVNASAENPHSHLGFSGG